MKFGSSSISWPISNADFNLMQASSTQCVGAFFSLDTTGTSAPPWIVGDTFLKNVYSVFRASPGAVGFAELSGAASAGTPGAGSSGSTNGGNGSKSAAAASARAPLLLVLLAGALAVLVA